MNMLSSAKLWNAVAGGYAEVTMKIFHGYAEEALKLTGMDKQSQILDVACGPGTLALMAAKQVAGVKAIDFSDAMVSILEKSIRSEGISNIETRRGDGQALPYKDSIFDAAYSMFGLMFFPDRMKGYSEIYRTLKPGGQVVISSWAPVSQSPAMQILYGALKAIDPDMPDPQTDIESLENPDLFKDELNKAGFKDVQIHAVTKEFPVESPFEFWEGMVKGSAPLVMLKNSMSKSEWEECSDVALYYLEENLGDYPTTLSSDAWLGYGVKRD